MDDRQRQLPARIEAAFAGVKRGDGVGMPEADVIDRYGSVTERRAACSADDT